ncbi:MAG: hypothetical protein IKO06_04750, partial [Alphaproteobacteria bacterium]|nr:hypothetical protein [Alphaproteobacteria bacterium]
MKKLSARAYFFKKMFDCFMVGMLLILLIFMWMLYKGPISVPYLKPYIVQALNYDENDYKIDIGEVNIELIRSVQPLRVTADKIRLQKKDGTVDINAPKLYLSFSLRALLKGIIAPSDISLSNPTAYIYTTYGVQEENQDDIGKKKLQFYVEKIKEFLANYNSEDKIYPESYVNNISVKGAEVEFHEVDFGRKWILSDVNFEFSRNLINLEVNANALVNINDKIASAGFESEYHAADDKLDLEFYFSDLVLSDLMSTYNETTEDNLLSVMEIEIPVNGKINTVVKMADILLHPDEAEDYIGDSVEKIEFELDGDHGYIAFDGNEKYNYNIDGLQISGVVTGGIDEIKIDNAELKMGGQKAQLEVYANGLEAYLMEQSWQDLAVRFKVKVDEFPFEKLSEFWPRYVAEPAWEWCKDGLTGGMAKNANFTFDFGYNRENESWGLLNLDGKLQLQDGDLYYLEGMPPVHNIYGTAKFSDHNIFIDIDKGISDGVIITGGNVNIYDLDKEDNFISIKLIGNSSVSDALKLIDNPPLEFTRDMGISPDTVKGNIDVKLDLDFELRQDLDAKDIKVDVSADLHKVDISDLLPNHIISADEMKLHVDGNGWQLSGDGKYDTVPLKLTMKESFAGKKYKSRSHVEFKLDKAAQKALGLDWNIISAPNIEGFALVNADVTVKENDIIEIDMNADLQNAKIDYSYLGFVKQNGEKAQATAHVIMKKDKIKEINKLSLNKPDFTIDGDIKMYYSGRVNLVNIHKISGPKTSARAKISLTDSDKPKIKIDISGSSYDLTALFDKTDSKTLKDKSETVSVGNEDDGLETVNDIDAFITVNSLWTNKTTPIKNFAGSAKLRTGIGIDEVHLIGNYGIDKSIKVNLDYVPRGKNEHYLSIDS